MRPENPTPRSPMSSFSSSVTQLLSKVDSLPEAEKAAALEHVNELQAKLTPKLSSALPGMYSQYDKAGKHWYAPNKVCGRRLACTVEPEPAASSPASSPALPHLP